MFNFSVNLQSTFLHMFVEQTALLVDKLMLFTYFLEKKKLVLSFFYFTLLYVDLSYKIPTKYKEVCCYNLAKILKSLMGMNVFTGHCAS